MPAGAALPERQVSSGGVGPTHRGQLAIRSRTGLRSVGRRNRSASSPGRPAEGSWHRFRRPVCGSGIRGPRPPREFELLFLYVVVQLELAPPSWQLLGIRAIWPLTCANALRACWQLLAICGPLADCLRTGDRRAHQDGGFACDNRVVQASPQLGAVWRPLAGVPLPLRCAIIGGVVLGCVGAFVGLVVGLRVYASTAWFAILEVGVPAAVLGAILGLVVGCVARLLWKRTAG